jgi:hypothetical protein
MEKLWFVSVTSIFKSLDVEEKLSICQESACQFISTMEMNANLLLGNKGPDHNSTASGTDLI